MSTIATTSTTSSLHSFSPPIHYGSSSNNNNNNSINKLLHFSTQNKSSYQPLISCQTLSILKTLHFQTPNQRLNLFTTKKPRKNNYKTLATSSEDAAVVIPAETAQDIVSSTGGDDGVSSIISILLFIAFVALSILTVGVIYIGVTDFLQKREKEKFEKEEAAKKKKSSGKKVRTRARAGPRGFGQKIEDDYDDL